MSVLTDLEIQKRISQGDLIIDPLYDRSIQPSSVDVRLSREVRVFTKHTASLVDPLNMQEDLTELVELERDKPFILHPGEFVLGSTVEYIQIPNDLVARIEGKSSLGRIGLMIHSTAGYIDPGFRGTVTLELSNVLPVPIALWGEMFIGQISFVTMTGEVSRPYGSPQLGSKYQNQLGPTESRIGRAEISRM